MTELDARLESKVLLGEPESRLHQAVAPANQIQYVLGLVDDNIAGQIFGLEEGQ